MTVRRGHPSKKEPRYLEDITRNIEGPRIQEPRDLFTSDRFLGLYDEKGIMTLLEESGMKEILSRKGYQDLRIQLANQDSYTSRLYVSSESRAGEDVRLVELIVREGVFRPKQTFVPDFDFRNGLSMLLIEWLALQDPAASFTPERPRLPGQQHPGLGGLKNMQKVLYIFGRDLEKDAIIDIPEFYHAAVIYSRLYSEIYSRMYSFFSPIDAGTLGAIMRDFSNVPLAEVSFAVTFDCLLNARTGEPFSWKPSEQMYPISRRLNRYFERKEYKEKLEATMNELSFVMDWERFERLRKEGTMDAV